MSFFEHTSFEMCDSGITASLQNMNILLRIGEGYALCVKARFHLFCDVEVDIPIVLDPGKGPHSEVNATYQNGIDQLDILYNTCRSANLHKIADPERVEREN